MQKKGPLGPLQKNFFRSLKKHDFFALFENRQKTLVWSNNGRPFMKTDFFIFVSKPIKNTFEKNIASNLP
jgi:hypothetical protein